jgi:hypothetical protein
MKAAAKRAAARACSCCARPAAASLTTFTTLTTLSPLRSPSVAPAFNGSETVRRRFGKVRETALDRTSGGRAIDGDSEQEGEGERAVAECRTPWSISPASPPAPTTQPAHPCQPTETSRAPTRRRPARPTAPGLTTSLARPGRAAAAARWGRPARARPTSRSRCVRHVNVCVRRLMQPSAARGRQPCVFVW